MTTREVRFAAALGLITCAAIFVAACSEKIVGNRPAGSGSIRIITDMAPALRPALGISSYLLTVTGPAMDPVVALLAIDDVDGALVGDSVDIPHGLDRKFEVRGVNIVPIYVNDELRFDTTDVLHGEAIADVVPGAPLILKIQLIPVAPIFYFSPRYVTAEWSAPFEIDLRMFNIDSVAEIEGQLFAYDTKGREVILVDSMVRGGDVNQDVPLEKQGGWFLFHQDTTIANRVLLFPQDKGGQLLRLFMTVRYDQAAIPVDTIAVRLSLYGVTRIDRKVLPRQPIYVDNAQIELHRTPGAAAARVLEAAGRLEDRKQ